MSTAVTPEPSRRLPGTLPGNARGTGFQAHGLAVLTLVLILSMCVPCHAADDGASGKTVMGFFQTYVQKIQRAYGRTPKFEPGKGSEKVIKTFVNKVMYGGRDPKSMLTDAAILHLQKRIGPLSNQNLINHFVSPNAESFKFHALTGVDKVLGPGLISRQASVMVNAELEGIDYTSLVVLDVSLRKTGEKDWQIEDVTRVKEDLTVANTGWIYKIYYFFLLFSFVSIVTAFFQNLGNKNFSNNQIKFAVNASGGASIAGALLGFGIVYAWLAYFFPLVYMSHLGLFWGLSYICSMTAQNIKQEDIATNLFRRLKLKSGIPIKMDLLMGKTLSYLSSPYARITSGLIMLIPVLFFLAHPEKFTPAQSSVMNIKQKLPSVVQVIKPGTPMFSSATGQGKSLVTGHPGDEFTFIERAYGQEGNFYKVLAGNHGIVYIPEAGTRLVEKVKTFSQESDFLNTILDFSRIPAPYDYPPEVAKEIARHYLGQGMISVNTSSFSGHLEALALFDEALKCEPENEEVHLAKIFSILEIDRYLLRDNLFNVFSLFHDSAVSYNKVRGLAATAIRYLLTTIKTPERYSARDSLIGLAYLLIDDVDRARKEIERTVRKSRYSKYAHALITEDPAQALQIIDDLIKQDHTSSLFWHERGKALVAMENIDLARLAFEQAVSLGTGNDAAILAELATRLESVPDGQKLAICSQVMAMEKNYNSEAKLCEWLIRNGRNMKIVLFGALAVLGIYIIVRRIRYVRLVPTLKNASIVVVLMWLITWLCRNPFEIENRTMAVFRLFYDLYLPI